VKQLDLTRLVSSSVRREAKTRGWKSIDGQAYWKDGHLFFVLAPLGVARQRSFHSSLRFKWFSLDDQLWKVLGLSSNASAPMSLRANGAFTITGQDLLEDRTTDCDWSPEWVQAKVSALASVSADRSAKVVNNVRTIDDYLTFIERGHTALMARYPNAVVNIWTETLLVALEKNDRGRVADIATARIQAQDPGTFLVGGRTFYHRALEYVQRDA
jgi:hypothetical protein